MTSTFRPMLAATIEDLEQIKFPVYASPKLDGIRCLIRTGVALSRSLKPIPNQALQYWVRDHAAELEGCDGELMISGVKFNEISSVFMSRDKVLPNNWYYAVFDKWNRGADSGNFGGLGALANRVVGGGVHCVVLIQSLINSVDRLAAYERDCLADGYEGVILRGVDAPYKHGRSTLREGYLLKLKRFTDGEAKIIGCLEKFTNTNVAKVSELGLTKRSHAKAGLVGANTLGALLVADCATGAQFEIGSGFDAETAAATWANRNDVIGAIVKYKHFEHGALDKPRHGVFLGFRDVLDMSV